MLSVDFTPLHSCPGSAALCNERPLIKGKGERRGYLSPVQPLPHLHWCWFYQLEILLGQKDLKLASYFKVELIKYAKVYFCATTSDLLTTKGRDTWMTVVIRSHYGRREVLLWAWHCHSVAAHLSSIQKVLGSIPSTTRNEKILSFRNLPVLLFDIRDIITAGDRWGWQETSSSRKKEQDAGKWPMPSIDTSVARVKHGRWGLGWRPQ